MFAVLRRAAHTSATLTRRAPTFRTGGGGARLVTLLALAALTASCDEGSKPPQPIASAFIGPDGGTLQVADGDYAGLRVDVPPGAVTALTEFTVTEVIGVRQAGYRPLGRAVILGPRGRRFDAPIEVTMPLFESAQAGSDVAMLLYDRDADGVELGPALSDASGAVETVTVPTRDFAQFWPVERVFGGDPTDGFLPLGDGDEWLFEDGLRVAVEQTDTEPNLDGQSVFKLALELSDRDLGFYLVIGTSGNPQTLGSFSSTGLDPTASGDGSFQLLHDAIDFLPAQVTPTRARELLVAFEAHRPFGTGDVLDSGLLTESPFVERRPDATTPLGTFETIMEVDLRQSFDAGGEGEDVDLEVVLTLSKDVGPVAVRVFGSEYRLESGSVGGTPIPSPNGD